MIDLYDKFTYLLSPSYPQAAELSLEESRDLSNPYRQSKDLVLKQYGIWNGAESQNMTLPPIIMSTSLPGHGTVLVFGKQNNHRVIHVFFVVGKHQKRSNNLGSTQLKVRYFKSTPEILDTLSRISEHILDCLM